MSGDDINLELPANIDRYVAALARVYSAKKNVVFEKILVNARIRVHETWTYDNWNGGTYGHALYLEVPEIIFVELVDEIEDIRRQLANDINKIHNVQNEYIQEVFIEMATPSDIDWRKKSGLLVSEEHTVTVEEEARIWEQGCYRVFLSHKAEVKIEVAKLKDELGVYGISAFVAHKDIHPTREWQNEIENALNSMDALVALLTENFHDSNWTDQEVGFAFGRGVPIIAVRLGMDPYGFLGRFQALSCPWSLAAKEIVKLLIKHGGMVNAFIDAVHRCSSFDNGNALSEILPFINALSEQQIDSLTTAYNEELQVRESFGFNGNKPSRFGDGLIPHLNRLSEREFILSRGNRIKQVEG